jgi:hypothetical protein
MNLSKYIKESVIMKFEKVYEEVKEMFPNMTDGEIGNLIDEALEQKPVQKTIIGYICHVKVNEKHNEQQ